MNAAYNIKITPLVVGEPPKSATPEVELLKKHSIDDASKVRVTGGTLIEVADVEKTTARRKTVTVRQPRL